MDFNSIVSAFVQAGGYAALCALLIFQSKQQIDAHREEVAKLAEVIRQNAAAVAALTAKLGVEVGPLDG